MRPGGFSVFSVLSNRKAIDHERNRWLCITRQIEALLEAINTSAGIYQLLLTGEERVTLRANVNDDVLLGGAGTMTVASATNSNLLV